MKKAFSSFLFLVTIFVVLSLNHKVGAQSCYELVWSDEFNIPGYPDSTKWTYEVGNNNGSNNELQYYTAKRLENARIEDTVLIIEARKETYNGFQYTSARMNTYSNNLNWKYGKIEARMRLPYGKGIWPAFWMLGKSFYSGTSWPACGEIDIMELVGGGEGKDDVVLSTLHWADANNSHAQYGLPYQLKQGIFADAYHTFSLEWNATTIRSFVDGIQYYIIDITPADLNEFKANFFLILNLAVGGDWPGNPDATTIFPQKMYVDYIRVYQLNKTPTIEGDTLVVKGQKNLTFSTIENSDFIYEWNVPNDAQIISGQGTHRINVNWGCTSGEVTCNLTTKCDVYNLQLPVAIADLSITGKEVVNPNELNIHYSVPLTMEASYVWTLPESVTSTVRIDTNKVFLNWGTKDETLMVTVENACGLENASLDVFILRQFPYPNFKQPHAIPGTIESVDYDMGGEGVAYHDAEKANQGANNKGIRLDEGVDTEANDGGYNVGWTEPGEWLEYTVSVAASKKYDIEIRFASQSTSGRFKLSFNGEERTSVVSVPNSGGWGIFKSIYLKGIQLYDTDTLMRVDITASGFNLGRMIFTEASDTDVPSNASKNISIYPTITSGTIFIQNLTNQSNFIIIDITGNEVKKGIISTDYSVDVSDLYPGSYFMIIDEPKGLRAYKFIKIQ